MHLSTRQREKLDHPIYFVSVQLNGTEQNYATMEEHEGLTMVYVVKKFRHYLLANKFIFFTNYQPILYLTVMCLECTLAPAFLSMEG